MPELVAAGALMWRRPALDGESGTAGGIEVAVVHRPRYDDWSWPKGKPHGREPLPVTAVREATEETGYAAVLGCRLGSTHYPVAAGEKVAHYWAARAVSGHFVPSEEVDQLRWLSPADAAELLSYPHDRILLADLATAVATTATVLLVRHAKAGRREAWPGDDQLRPLTAAGRRQAAALRELLPLFGAARVYSAPPVRCRQTVDALAADLGVPVITEPLLSEQDYPAAPEAALQRLCSIAAGPGPAVVCSQGRVVPDLVSRLADAGRLELSNPLPSRKGSFWVLSFGGGPGSPTLLAADYCDDPRS